MTKRRKQLFMKYIILIALSFFTNSFYSQNYNKVFKAIEISDFDKTDILIKELKEDKDADSTIICLANALIYSNKNYKDYNPIKSYEFLLSAIKSNSLESKKVIAIVKKFEFNLGNIKSDIENKVYDYSLGINEIGTYKRIINLCYTCNYLEKANAELEKLEFDLCTTKNTIDGYNEFISKYPKSKNISSVIDKRDLLEFNLSKKNISSLTEFISKFPQSKFKEKAILLRDSMKNNFECVYYYENGNISSKGRYKENNKIGKWISYNENGSTSQIEIYDESGLGTSEIIYYDENGQINERRSFKNGEQISGDFSDGEHISYQNGKISERKSYKDGKLDGQYIEYTNNGEIRNRTNYLNGIKNGEEYSELNGETTIAYNINGNYSGEYIKKDSQGRIIFQGYYSEGSKVGEWKAYRYNNRVRETSFEGNFSNGSVKFYNNGSIYKIENYKNGKLNGDFKEYNKDKLITSGKFLNGYPSGNWFMKYKDGQPKFNGSSSENGVYFNFDKFNNFDRSDDSHDFDIPVSIFFTGNCEFFYRNGKLLFKGDFTNGEVKYYLQNGKVCMIENYKEGKLISKTELISETVEYNTHLRSINKTKKYHYNDSKKVTKIEFYFQNASIAQIREDVNESSDFGYCNYGLPDEGFIEKNIELMIFSNDKIVFNGYSQCVNSQPLLSNENTFDFKNGHLIFYRQNLQKMSEGEILDGNEVGLWKNYDEDENIIETVFYSDSIINTYFKNGNIKRIQKCKNYKLNGETIDYYPNGQIKSVENYLNGKLDCRVE